MAESRFIKTVTFGGYDRTDVDKRLDGLYLQVCDLKNELRETKLTLESYKKGTDEEKSFEQVLSVERAKLTEVQVKNEAMSEKIKTSDDELKKKDKELAELKEENARLKEELETSNSKLSAYEAGNDAAALGAVFIEAQKSRSMLLDSARQEAQKLEADSKKLAENIITDADNKAAQIIYDTEKFAAESEAFAINKAEEMKVASGNMKAALMTDMESIGVQISALKKVLESFEKNGSVVIAQSEEMINNAKEELRKDGIPVFKMPEHFEAELPPVPELKPVDFSGDSEKAEASKKKNSDLEKLQAMADAIGGGKSAPASGSVDLDALAKQAEALAGDSKPAKNSKKGGGAMDLDALAKMAAELNG